MDSLTGLQAGLVVRGVQKNLNYLADSGLLTTRHVVDCVLKRRYWIEIRTVFNVNTLSKTNMYHSSLIIIS